MIQKVAKEKLLLFMFGVGLKDWVEMILWEGENDRNTMLCREGVRGGTF